MIKRIVQKVFNSFGYNLVKKQDSVNRIEAGFYNELRLSLSPQNDEVLSIVFSKDRAMQLHAFIMSYLEQVSNHSKLVVLYKASSPEHKLSYLDLQQIFSSKEIFFMEETDFRKQLINVLESDSAGRLIFYVDDIIITHPFDYHILKGINPFTTVFSLSRGLDLTYSAVLLKDLKLPGFKKTEQDLYSFDWSEIKELSDWSYPLGVTAYLFSRLELLSIVKVINFKAPNSLEYGMQEFLPVFATRPGLCTKNAIAVCVHANLTQAEYINPALDNFGLEELLKKWNEGLQIDYRKFYNLPMTTSQIKDYEFVPRSN